MKVYLLNSAMMPQPGNYQIVEIEKNIFEKLLKKFYNVGILVNYIGYEQNLKLIAEWCEIQLTPNRTELTDLKSGDILLIMKLKYRLKDAREKSNKNFQSQLTLNDFEFFVAKYSAPITL